MRRLRDLLRSPHGTTTVEFAVIAPLFFVLLLSFIELSIGYYWWKSTQKAAQIGARWAIVRDVAASGVPATNLRSATGVFGLPCQLDPSPCGSWPQASYVCDGASGAGCTAGAFDALVTRMRAIFPAFEAENVRVTYWETGLGYAGGPSIPAVTVTLTEVPFQLGVLGLITGLIGGGRTLLTLPDISATFTGEDLSSAGVGT